MIITEQLRYSTKLQTFWQEIIKKYKKKRKIKYHPIKKNMKKKKKIKRSIGTFNKIWTEKIVSQVKQKEKLKRARDNNSDSSELVKQKGKLKRVRDNNSDSSGFITKQIQILEQNKDKLVYRQVVNDATLIVSAYENLVSGNIIPFIEILKTFLLTRSQMYLFSADEPVLQAIVESLLPLKYCIPELSLVMDGTKPKGFGRFGYSDIFILKGIGNNNVSLELKYISLVGLIKNQKKKFNTNDLENLDKIIEKEDEKVLLKRLYTYWSKEHNETRQTTIEDILNNGVNQLKSYMNIISKGKTIDYYSSGIFDKRIKITKSNSNKLEGFVILVIGFLLNTTYPGIPVLFKNQQAVYWRKSDVHYNAPYCSKIPGGHPGCIQGSYPGCIQDLPWINKRRTVQKSRIYPGLIPETDNLYLIGLILLKGDNIIKIEFLLAEIFQFEVLTTNVIYHVTDNMVKFASRVNVQKSRVITLDASRVATRDLSRVNPGCIQGDHPGCIQGHPGFLNSTAFDDPGVVINIYYINSYMYMKENIGKLECQLLSRIAGSHPLSGTILTGGLCY
ncbi:hypothetical protein GLOIN_2v1829862 [Rhizophagus irregularis DAOM 181602=DAOM 197198]|uniref:Uncharacterized protein n=1 Tax=Rhizophagus irregularis (strain DAOM 181602 / DAOM 197198 / MUCL 43194) TaxID=747089 RepID=A0A2P4Q3U2_RHIID|nr:hypothetical protein GLOIN_2v1829862 [Rhizophagus irregularis DAOM 181602=DAOM 197198]POG72284.1 hypothetical protein GLOIN_2v1829862 [Rhizophagus irregularis DAOM 181602=DAOM 197198]|eukprot:XP_025179150.1 hypothetical protein GLOIN_2v1829862 [Rhizophagus irregularis DAOM 181602=DAOM 197198]